MSMTDAATSGRRGEVLQALGITPWVRRAPAALAEPAAAEATATSALPLPSSRCVVLLPAGASTRALDLLGRALHAGGAAIARAGRLRVAAGGLDGALPEAPVYLAFGAAQAHALGRELPAAAMAQAHIALVDEPDQLLVDPAAKRRLWVALRQARRALAAVSAGH